MKRSARPPSARQAPLGADRTTGPQENTGHGPRERRQRWLGAALLVVVTLAAYSNSFHTPFIFDGQHFIVRNPAIRTFETARLGNRPVGTLSFWANYRWHGFHLPAFHATNLTIHLIGGLALFGLARRTLQLPRLAPRYGPSATSLAWVIAALWTVHPLQTQAVTYLYQRFESLMGMFFLLAMLAFLRGATAARGLSWFAAAAACGMLSAGTKEVAAALPLLAIWYDRVFLAGSWSLVAQHRKWAHLALAVSVWGTLAALMVSQWGRYVAAGVGEVKEVTAWQYATSQPAAILTNLRLAFWPQGQCLDYLAQVPTRPVDWVPAAALLLLLLAATGWAILFRPRWGFLGGWFFLILAPTSSIVPIVDLVFEHRVYLSLAAVAAATTLLGFRAFERLADKNPQRQATLRRAYRGVSLAAIAILALATYRRNADYATAETMWRDIIAKRPTKHSGRARNALGQLLLEQQRYQAAFETYREAAELRPHDPDHRTGMAIALVQLRKLDAAEALLQQVLSEKPQHADAHYNLGAIHALRGQPAAALREYQAALEANANHLLALQGVAGEHLSQGRLDAAIDLLRQAQAQAPDNQGIRRLLAQAWARKQDYPQAIALFQEVLAAEPDDAVAHFNLATTYLLCGQREAAARHLRQALHVRPDLQPAQQLLRQIEQSR